MTEMNRSLKEIHDRLMADKPEGAVHDQNSCSLCAMTDEPTTPGGGGDMTTYTEDELRAKVDEAVKAATEAKDTKIAELEGAQASDETAKAVKAAVEPLEIELSQVRADLDKKVLEAANAAAERDAITAWLEAEATVQTEREAAASRKDERLTKLKEVASFPEEYLATNADRFASMSEDEFTARCAEYAALAKPGDNSKIPSTTPALKAGLEGPGSSGRVSAVKELLALRRDPRGHVDLSSL